MENTTENTEKTKERILKASWARFCHYGFGKTTMAEIGEDCEMSAANIYRFFEGKKAIMAELVKRLFRETENKLLMLIKQDAASSLEKLRAFMFVEIELTHERVANQPKIRESVDFIQNERPELIREHMDKLIGLIEKVVIEGQQTGEFGPGDSKSTAEAVFAATIMFHSPFFIATNTKEELKNLCEQVIDLLGTGLLHRC